LSEQSYKVRGAHTCYVSTKGVEKTGNLATDSFSR
jgi:hypothetical protein